MWSACQSAQRLTSAAAGGKTVPGSCSAPVWRTCRSSNFTRTGAPQALPRGGLHASAQRLPGEVASRSSTWAARRGSVTHGVRCLTHAVRSARLMMHVLAMWFRYLMLTLRRTRY